MASHEKLKSLVSANCKEIKCKIVGTTTNLAYNEPGNTTGGLYNLTRLLREEQLLIGTGMPTKQKFNGYNLGTL